MASTTTDQERHARTYALLDEHTSQRHFIEYDSGLFNHMSHALYSLDRLRAPVEMVEKFVSWMVENKMESAESHRERKGKTLGLLDGSYYDDYADYTRLLREKYAGSLEELIAGEFPKLVPNMIISALHGIIHLGYGYASGRDWFVLEGLAFLRSTVPLHFQPKKALPDVGTLGMGTLDILDVLDLVRTDPELCGVADSLHKKLGKYARFTRRAVYIIENASDRLFEFVHRIKFPAEVTAQGRDFGDQKACAALSKWLVDSTIVVFVTAEKVNDFFLLHGVTSAWGLANVLPLLKSNGDILESVRTFLACILVVYMTQGSAFLDRSLLTKNTGMEHDWAKLIQMAIDHEEYEREHMYKLVQVCKDMSDINTDPTLESTYRLASYNCVANHFALGKSTLSEEEYQKYIRGGNSSS